MAYTSRRKGKALPASPLPSVPPDQLVPGKHPGQWLPARDAAHWKDWQYDLAAFRDSEALGLDKFSLLRSACSQLYPAMKWNDWLEAMLQGFCDRQHATISGGTVVRTISLVGVAGAGKTFSIGRFAFLWWLCDIHNSTAILTSTTKGAVGQRVWPVIQQSYHEARRNLAALHGLREEAVDLGNLVDSQKMLQASKGDAQHAIFAQAVKGGETAKAEAFIRGQHAPRMLVAIDEAGETPEAIYGVVSNLRKACKDFTLIVSDNPVSRLNPHGRCCQPKGGWGFKPLHSTSWPTQGIPEWQIEPGLCLQFRGSDSPNVKAGRTVHPHIYSWEDYQASLKEGVRNTLRYWRYDAGDWAPDGTCKTIFNETMALQCRVQEKVTFLTVATPVSFCDPGFGGDACIQMIGLLGDIEAPAEPHRGTWAQGIFPTGPKPARMALMVTHVLELELAQDRKDPAGNPMDLEHQLARQIIINCKAHNVVPANFGLYSTGTGKGIASVLFTDWSDGTFKVEEGGLPSELPVSESDRRPAKLVYDRRVTELWFNAKELALGRQLYGIDNATLVELCAREYDTTGKPWKYRVETKDEFRPKLGHSPDRGDALCGLVELVRVKHGVLGGGLSGEGVERVGDDWQKDQQQGVEALEASYSDTNEREEVTAMQELVGIESL